MQIESNRLIIKQYLIEDTESFFYLVKANEEFLREGFPVLLKLCETLKSTQQFIRTKNDAMDNDIAYLFGVFKKENSQLIGHIFTKEIDWSLPKVEVGYWITAKENNKGFASEALTALTENLLYTKNFVKVFLRVIPENSASAKVAIKAGFEVNGILKKDFKDYHGKISDVVYYGKVNNTIL